ncbi:MAG: fibronectin type III domain-containing protein [Ruminococcus sp.]|nr:fibronectin type III domain-containing protein [Ruminococcus sp.]
MRFKRMVSGMCAFVMAGSCLAMSASAATWLPDVVHPDPDNAEINDAYYSIGALGFYMNNNWEKWQQSSWVGIDDTGTIDMTFEIKKEWTSKEDPDALGSLGMMGIMIANMPGDKEGDLDKYGETYPYNIRVLEANFTDPKGKVTEFESIKAITEANKHPEGGIRLIIRPNDEVNEETGEVTSPAAPEVAGWGDAGAFKGGTLHIKLCLAEEKEPEPQPVSIKGAKIKVANKTYTGKALKPAAKVTLDGKTLKKDTDYTISYKNNKNCGKATVTVKGKGDYCDSKSGSFIIKPKKAAVKKFTAEKKGTAKLTWKKSAGKVDGYKVQVALNKKFKGAKTYTVKKAATVSKTVTKLKSKKVYYARVSAFKKVGKTTYKGAWSAVKKAKIK